MMKEICSICGHEWEPRTKNPLKYKPKCPICSGKFLKTGFNDLKTVHPEFLDEWDYEKNATLLPTMVTSVSQKKVWWKCSKNHSYQQKIGDKVNRNFKCPVCVNRKIVKGINDLSTVFPEILKEWDYEKNKDLNPETLSSKTTKKVWWKCIKNHSWYASVYERVYHDKTGCPYCSKNRLVIGKNDLLSVNPLLAKEFHPSKNENITPSTITAHNSKKIWWICPKGHEYESSVDKRMNGQGCPYCSNKLVMPGFNDLETLFPQISKEWDFEKNKDLTPKEIIPGTRKKVWWICSDCGKSFYKSILERTRNGAGCSECSAKKRVKTRMETLLKAGSLNDDKDLLIDWDYEANYPKTPSDYTRRSGSLVHWKCHNCGYQWKSTILNKSRRNKCPACLNKVVIPGRNDLATTDPQLSKEWHPTKNEVLTPQKVTRGCGKKVWWICPMGHEYQATILQRNGGYGTGCPICSSGRQTSFAEQAIYFYIKKIFPDAVNRYKAPFLGKMELDIYIPSIRWGIEYDGMAWHNANTVDREKRKYEACRKENIKLYRLQEAKKEFEFGTCDRSMHTADMWTYKKLNQTIYNLLMDLCRGFFKITFNINVEKDRFLILENYQIKLKDSIVAKFPQIAKEWNYKKNGNLKPEMVSHGTSMKVWWTCSKCGNVYEASVGHRCDGTGCPKCARERTRKSHIKKVACISLKTGETIKIYNSITEACKELNMKSSANVTSVCKGIRPNAGGYFWQYVE